MQVLTIPLTTISTDMPSNKTENVDMFSYTVI